MTMADKVRGGRKSDDRDVVRKSVVRDTKRSDSVTTDRLGREQQRRATAYGRARGQA